MKKLLVGSVTFGVVIALFLSYQKILFRFAVGKSFPATTFSTFSSTQTTVPLMQSTTWLGLWDMRAGNSLTFLKELDMQLKKGLLPPQQSFALIVIDPDQRAKLERIIDENEFSFLILIDDQNKSSKVIWEGLPRPAFLGVNPEGIIIRSSADPGPAEI